MISLAYRHKGLKPKVVHHYVRNTKTLLDRKWNPKISDFRLAYLLGYEISHVTTWVIGTSGYVHFLWWQYNDVVSSLFLHPAYRNLFLQICLARSTWMLNEGRDVFNLWVLLMWINTRRNPVDYCRAPREVSSKIFPFFFLHFFSIFFLPFFYYMDGFQPWLFSHSILSPTLQMNLVDCFKVMVASYCKKESLESLIQVNPPPKPLKWALFVCLCCINLDPLKRPKRGRL